MKVLICGSRHWPEHCKSVIFSPVIHHLSSDDVIVSGAAKGVDAFAAEAGKMQGLRVMEFPAEWGKYGRAAGSIRNSKMLKVLEEGDQVWAFYLKGVSSPGTNNMVRQARGKFLIRKTVVDPETGETEHYETPANKGKSSG